MVNSLSPSLQIFSNWRLGEGGLKTRSARRIGRIVDLASVGEQQRTGRITVARSRCQQKDSLSIPFFLSLVTTLPTTTRDALFVFRACSYFPFIRPLLPLSLLPHSSSSFDVPSYYSFIYPPDSRDRRTQRSQYWNLCMCLVVFVSWRRTPVPHPSSHSSFRSLLQSPLLHSAIPIIIGHRLERNHQTIVYCEVR